MNSRDTVFGPGNLPDEVCTSFGMDVQTFSEEDSEEGTVPGTVPLLPNKKHVKTRDVREFRIEDPDVLINRVREGGIDLVIGRDHDEVSSLPSPAAGWIDHRTGLTKNGKYGIKAKVEWTELGRESVRSRSFRYISPVLEIPGMGNFLYEDGPVPLVEGILAASIVNIPALRMPSLNSYRFNRETLAMNEEQLVQLREILGLPVGTSAEAILVAASGLRSNIDNRPAPAVPAIPDLNNWVPREEYAALAGQVSQLVEQGLRREIDDRLRRANEEGRIASPAYARVLREQLLSGALTLETFDVLIESAPQTTLTRRETVNNGGSGGLSEEEKIKAKCEELGLDPVMTDYCVRNKRDPKKLQDSYQRRTEGRRVIRLA